MQAQGNGQVTTGPGLQVRFGAQGLEQLSYAGQVLEDTVRWPDDRFHIWHMKCFDASGKPVTSGQFGWGESNAGRVWDASTHTWTYTFSWGSIQAHYEQRGDALDVQVKTTNRPGSGVVVDGATIYPLTLHPEHVRDAELRVADDVSGPGVTLEQWSSGEVAAVIPEAPAPLYSGFQPGKDGAVQVFVSGTLPDALPAVENAPGRRVPQGRTDSFTVSLRFAPETTPLASLSEDADRNWSARWPETLHWTDRRIIGTVFLASSPQGDKTQSGGYPSNPRRYFNDPTVDTISPAGLRRFQARVLEQARTVATNLKRMDAQGAITWDLEGEQYPQDTSYVCAPDQIARAAPEMESVVADHGSPYAGMKLDDAYFKLIRDAGFRVGVCVRPQRFALGADGTAIQTPLSDTEAAAEMIRKVRYAHDRWGATIFYVDSTVRAGGLTLPSGVLDQVSAAVPDSLVIPEESEARMYRSTAPFQTFLFHGDLGTPAAVRLLYPHAFSANLVNDVSPAQLEAHHADLVTAVRQGDILMVLAGFWQANDPAVVEIYREAARKNPDR